MGRWSDLEAGGGRFDSRRAQVIFVGHVWNAFALIFRYVRTGLGKLLGSRLGHFLVGSGSLFGRVGVICS